jgi:hypothetical protein
MAAESLGAWVWVDPRAVFDRFVNGYEAALSDANLAGATNHYANVVKPMFDDARSKLQLNTLRLLRPSARLLKSSLTF